MKSSKEQIVAAAGELFRQKGYEATTLADIAERVGLLKGSLYYHISSKEELLLEVASRPVRKMIAEVKALLESEQPIDVLLGQALELHIYHLHEDYPEIFVYLQERFGSNKGEIAELSREYQQLFVDLVQRGMAEGRLRDDVAPRLTVFALLGACNWMHKWYQPGGDWAIEDVQDTFSSILLNGLRP